MMIHQFFLMTYADIPKDKGCYCELIEGKKVVEIDDKIVGNNKLFFKGFSSFKVSFKNPGEGIDYGGITIIPTDSLDNFIANMIAANEMEVIPETTTVGPDGDSFTSEEIIITPLMHKQLDDLVALAQEAKEKGLYLVHFGL